MGETLRENGRTGRDTCLTHTDTAQLACQYSALAIGVYTAKGSSSSGCALGLALAGRPLLPLLPLLLLLPALALAAALADTRHLKWGPTARAGVAHKGEPARRGETGAPAALPACRAING